MNTSNLRREKSQQSQQASSQPLPPRRKGSHPPQQRQERTHSHPPRQASQSPKQQLNLHKVQLNLHQEQQVVQVVQVVRKQQQAYLASSPLQSRSTNTRTSVRPPWHSLHSSSRSSHSSLRCSTPTLDTPLCGAPTLLSRSRSSWRLNQSLHSLKLAHKLNTIMYAI